MCRGPCPELPNTLNLLSESARTVFMTARELPNRAIDEREAEAHDSRSLLAAYDDAFRLAGAKSSKVKAARLCGRTQNQSDGNRERPLGANASLVSPTQFHRRAAGAPEADGHRTGRQCNQLHVNSCLQCDCTLTVEQVCLRLTTRLKHGRRPHDLLATCGHYL